MPASKVIIRPGVNNVQTPLLNEGGWSSSQLIRFFQGLAQKLGGWAKFIGEALYGTSRGIFAWEDLNGQPYVVSGQEGTLQVVYQTDLYDITPVISTQNLTNPFTTVSGTDTIVVNDTAHGELLGDVINIVTETAINGKLLQGYISVTEVIDADNFEASTGVTFTASVSGATTALYTTSNGSSIVTVTLTNHGRVAGEFYSNTVSTAVGGLTIDGTYLVATVIDADNFTFDYGSNASSTANGKENGGDIRMEYLMHAGLSSSTFTGGYGIGSYGVGTYGIGVVGTAISPLRQWFFGNWGKLLIANFTNGGIYYWDPDLGGYK